MRQLHLIFMISMILISCTMSSNSGNSGVNDFSYINGEAISKELLFEIGPDHELVAGNFANAKVLSDGRIAILDTRSLAFHIINADGSLFNSTSIQGRGPGEVENLNNDFAIRNDEEIVLYDYLMRKLSFYKYSDNTLNHVKDLQLESNKSISDYFYHTPDQLIIHRSSSLIEKELIQPVTLLTLNEPLTEKTIIEIPKHRDLEATTTQGTLNLTFNYSSKYHTKNNICALEDKIYHNRTDSVGFTVYDLNSGAQLAN